MCRSNYSATPGRRRGAAAQAAAFVVAVLVAAGVTAGIAVVVHRVAAAVFAGGFLVTVAVLAGCQWVKRYRALVWRAAHRDRLTGLPDRAVAEQVLDVVHRSGGGVAVALVDVDALGAVNMAAGYQAGDRYLCTVAARLAGGVPPGVVVARLAGDDFVVIAAGMDAQMLAAAVAAALAEPGPVAGTVVLRAGVGVAAASAGDTGEPRAVLARADAALRTAKWTGNRVVVYDCHRDGPILGDGGRPVRRRRDRQPVDTLRWVPGPGGGVGPGWLVCSAGDLATLGRAVRTAQDWWSGVLAGTGSTVGQPTPTAEQAQRQIDGYRDLAVRLAAIAGEPA